MKCISILLLVGSVLLSAGCQVLSPQHNGPLENDGQHLLVTFAQSANSSRPLLGAKHYYQLRDEWRAPLRSRSDIDRVKRKHALVELDGWPINSLNMYCVLFRIQEGLELEPILAPQDQLHGTAVAGVIAAISNNGRGGAGLAPKAMIYGYGACNTGADRQSSICNSFDLAKALEHANEDEVQVLNLSLGGPADPLLARLLDYGLERGMIVVAANNENSPQNNFPASHPGVIAAGKPALGAISGTSSPWLNWFETAERFSTKAGGGYQYFYGSSISSAGMTGLAALVRSRFSALETQHLLNSVIAGDCSRLGSGSKSSPFEHAIGSTSGCLPAAVPVIASKLGNVNLGYEHPR